MQINKTSRDSTFKLIAGKVDFHELRHVTNTGWNGAVQRVVLKIQVLGEVHLADAIRNIASKTSIIDLDILKGNEGADITRELSIDIVIIQIERLQERKACDIIRDRTFKTDTSEV